MTASPLLDRDGWVRALMRCSSEDRIGVLASIWSRIAADERGDAFADAYSGGDLPSRSRGFILTALRWLEETDRRALDGDGAPGAFDELPDPVPVYRGAVAHEDPPGTSWTLDRGCALWFALRHGRFRRPGDPVLLSGAIAKDRLRVVLLDRGEREVVIDPAAVVGLRVDPADDRDPDLARFTLEMETRR
jgi:hypothetical protein